MLCQLSNPRVYVGFLALGALLALPLAVDSPFIYHVFVTICVYGALVTAWNIVGGYAGQLSLGHTIFYGIGGYTAALLIQSSGLSPWLGMWVGALIAALVGVVIGYPCFRLRGPFFVLATVACLEVVRLVTLNQAAWTGGAAGLIVPLNIGWEWMIFRERWASLLIAFGFLLFALGVSLWVRHARFGYYLMAVREREDAARAAGVNTVGVKLLAIALSAALTALIGSFHAMYTTFLEPESQFSLTLAIEIAMFGLIGGLGTVAGPLAGTLLVVPLTELARGWLGAAADGLHGLVYGVVLVVVVLTVPGGLVGQLGPPIGRWLDRLPGGRPKSMGSRISGFAVADSPGDAPRREIGPPVLVAEGLVKRFGGLVATDDVSLTLHRGEVLGIIGPNGAGKTTLFNLLSGFIPPDRGSVTIVGEDGRRLTPRSPHAFARAGMGRTFQIVQPFGALTVAENIMVGAFRHHARTPTARARALEVAKLVGLYDQRDVEARHLTIGGLKRLEVARVLALEPHILLLDEVMAGLNQTDVQQAVAMIKAIRDRGVSIIAIEHVMQAIMSLSDRVVVINAGRVLTEGEPQAVVQNRQVIEAYLGEDYVHAQAG
ncbi:MAG: ATP-binding cassette domain-containing protein [Candidatus Competibacterales bacterium]